ncbi:MAG: glycosyltransferase family 2 protein [Turicibacter sp.]|uniref:glycosyltransferase family 2 protein n=1 Tax=Weissella cibaria TaxID=137591 RepID=UPI001197B369|nr:glycosyltransferase family A protein [Weissella cibaria]TVV26440.1 glycosyltransferase family 2 protein [Weissella cibaria]
MNEKMITIVVPVFNSEKYIEESINSILNQTYKNFEILIINDGSTDDTQKVLEKLYTTNRKVKVVNTKNRGVSSARNLGINLASGEFLVFMDADDRLVKNALYLINEKLSKNISELFIFGFSVFNDNRRHNDTHLLEKLEKKPEVSNNCLLKRMLSTKNNLLGYVWRAAYSVEMLKKNLILFDEHLKISEDYLFLLKSIVNAKKIIVSSDKLYEYHLGESSMSNKYIPTLLEDMMWVNKWIESNIVSNNSKLKPQYTNALTNTYIRFVQNTLRDKHKSPLEKLQYIQVERNNYHFQEVIDVSFKNLNDFDVKSKIGVALFKYKLESLYMLIFTLKYKLSELF